LQAKFLQWQKAQDVETEILRERISQENLALFNSNPQAVIDFLNQLHSGYSCGEKAGWYGLFKILKINWSGKGRKFPKGCDYSGEIHTKDFTVKYKIGNKTFTAIGSACYDESLRLESASNLIWQKHFEK
jgi:hypothetical protein